MPPLHRILYCSRNCIEGPPGRIVEAIEDILARSRANNAREGITGALLFSAGSFVQVLEGPLEAIEVTFERIQRDGRHDDVLILQSQTIEARDFPAWSMSFAGADDEKSIPGLILSDGISHQTAAAEVILSLMRDVVVREEAWLMPIG